MCLLVSQQDTMATASVVSDCPLWCPASLSTAVSCREECMIRAGIQLEVSSLRTAHWLLHLQNAIVLYCTYPLTSVRQWCAGGGMIVTLMMKSRAFPYTLPAAGSADLSVTLTYSRRVERCTTKWSSTERAPEPEEQDIWSSKQGHHLVCRGERLESCGFILWLTIATY